jgi:hypothetical protein
VAVPSTVNGIGTGLIAASRKRKVNGQTQFDAIEAGMFFYLPILPYKALHVLNIGSEGESRQYQFIPLRLSWRLALKGILNRWGAVAGSFGLFTLGIASYAFATMARPLNNSDRTFLTIMTTVTLAGFVCKLAWLVLSKRDEKIKDLVGPHGLGSSDPRDWLPEHAEATIQSILQQESLPSLVEVARRAMKEGNSSYAAVCLRLAIRDPDDIEAQDLMNRLLAE